MCIRDSGSMASMVTMVGTRGSKHRRDAREGMRLAMCHGSASNSHSVSCIRIAALGSKSNASNAAGLGRKPEVEFHACGPGENHAPGDPKVKPCPGQRQKKGARHHRCIVTLYADRLRIVQPYHSRSPTTSVATSFGVRWIPSNSMTRGQQPGCCLQ